MSRSTKRYAARAKRGLQSTFKTRALLLQQQRIGTLTKLIMSPSKPTSSQNGEHYVWGEVCDGWHLLKEPDLSVIQERVPPGAGEVRHFHSKARQFFFVLSGIATLEFEDRAVNFNAGQGMHVPPGLVHRFVNASEAEVRFLVVSAPTTRGDRINS